MSDSIVVVGGGGHARVVVSLLQSLEYPIAGIVDDDEEKWGTRILGVSIVGPIQQAADLATRGLLAMGGNRDRQKLAGEISLEWIPLVHPRAWIHSSVRIGPGSVVFAGAYIQPGTMVGAHAIVNTAASIDHDCCIGDFAHLAPGVHLAGGVTVGTGTLMGISSCTIPGIDVGDWVTVGAGAAVTEDLPTGVTAVGVPARPLGQDSE